MSFGHRAGQGGGAIYVPQDGTGRATAAKLALMNAGGELHESGYFVFPSGWIDTANSLVAPTYSYNFFQCDTDEGEIEAGYTYAGYSGAPAGSFFLRTRGALVLSGGINNANAFSNNPAALDVMYWDVAYQPGRNVSRIAIGLNGSWSKAILGTTTGGALHAPTAAWIGSRQGTDHLFPGTYSQWTSYPAAALPPLTAAVYFVGDSRMGSVLQTCSVPSRMFAGSGLAYSKGLSACQAASGDTVQGQALEIANCTVDPNLVTAIVFQPAINNIIGAGESAALVSSRYIANLIPAAHAKFPNLVHLIGMVIGPSKGRAIEAYAANPGLYAANYADANALYQGILDHNNNMRGTGPNPITGLTSCFDSFYPHLCTDAFDFLDANKRFDSLHENTVGRTIEGVDLLTFLRSLGYYA